jgi:hypothetical protein
MNILYINHYAGSIYHGMEYRPYYLAKEWVDLGHNVTIVASNFSHLRKNNISLNHDKSYKIEFIDNIRYIWCRTSSYKTNGLKRLITICQFLYRIWQIKQVLIDFKPDIVIASSTYPFDTYIARYLSKKTNAKFIYEIHDLWPMTPMELNNMPSYHPFIWLMAKAEEYGYKHANMVVSLLVNSFDYMQTKGLSKTKFRYIPNGVSSIMASNQALPLEHQTKISHMRNKYSFIVGYCGGMGESNALKFFIQTAISMPDVGFILVGSGMQKDSLMSYTQNYPNILFMDPIDKTNVNHFLTQMDLLYIGWNAFKIYQYGVCPNKIFDYMLAKKPILHSINQENDIVTIANCGIRANAEDVADIKSKINYIMNLSIEKRLELGENGYDYVIKNHLYKDLAIKFIEGF